MIDNALYLMIVTVLSITLGAVSNGVIFTSTDSIGGAQGSSDTGSDMSSVDNNNADEEPPTIETAVEPELETEEGFACISEDVKCNPNIDPRFGEKPKPVPPEPLPYCDTAAGKAATSCHDRYDYGIIHC
jgi:hypothetical protein